MRRKIAIILCFVLSLQIWLSFLPLVLKKRTERYFSAEAMSPQAEKMLNYQVRIWQDPVLRERYARQEHKNNPEWDFMWRTFLVLSMTNVTLREPGREADLLPVMDTIIHDTVAKIDKNGLYYFLMPYGKEKPFVFSPARSLFHDGEIALMLSLRRLIKEDAKITELHKRFLKATIGNMQRCPLLSAESYPDECWLFCNTMSLMAIRISDYLDGTDNSRFIQAWLHKAKNNLIDPKTGLLHSAYTLKGHPLHGPEGSSIWMAVHCLSFVDQDFARRQFLQAKKELYFDFYGLGLSREWPLSWDGQLDCDAGGILAVLQASPSATAFAMLAARTFKDDEMTAAILPSIQLGGLPTEKDKTLKYSASNLVGDAVFLYAYVQGPLQERIWKP